MIVEHLGTLPYRQAWAHQEAAHQRVVACGEETILVVEHPPVITFGRRPGGGEHLLAPEPQLAAMGVELVQSDRGGDITFHGPGQIVVYPIVRLADHGFSVSGYVHTLEKAIIATLAQFNITASTDPTAIGVWVDDAKIAAIGVRIRRGVTLHGIALNVDTDLNYFNLIVPCGLAARPVTSVRKLLGSDGPPLIDVQNSPAGNLAADVGHHGG